MHSVFKSLIVFLLLFGFASFCAVAQDEEALKAYYDLETEDATDQSGNNLHGVVEGFPDLIDGPVGKAWEFNGTTRINMDYQDFKNATPALSQCVASFCLRMTKVGTSYSRRAEPGLASACGS